MSWSQCGEPLGGLGPWPLAGGRWPWPTPAVGRLRTAPVQGDRGHSRRTDRAGLASLPLHKYNAHRFAYQDRLESYGACPRRMKANTKRLCLWPAPQVFREKLFPHRP